MRIWWTGGSSQPTPTWSKIVCWYRTVHYKPIHGYRVTCWLQVILPVVTGNEWVVLKYNSSLKSRNRLAAILVSEFLFSQFFDNKPDLFRPLLSSLTINTELNNFNKAVHLYIRLTLYHSQIIPALQIWKPNNSWSAKSTDYDGERKQNIWFINDMLNAHITGRQAEWWVYPSDLREKPKLEITPSKKRIWKKT